MCVVCVFVCVVVCVVYGVLVCWCATGTESQNRDQLITKCCRVELSGLDPTRGKVGGTWSQLCLDVCFKNVKDMGPFSASRE